MAEFCFGSRLATFIWQNAYSVWTAKTSAEVFCLFDHIELDAPMDWSEFSTARCYGYEYLDEMESGLSSLAGPRIIDGNGLSAWTV